MTYAYERLSANLTQAAHLRVNVMDRASLGNVAVRYSYNMDFDADEHIEFPEGAGAVGRCYQRREPILVDLEMAKLGFQDYEMKRVHQALVRPTLCSLLCVPLFDPRGEARDLSEREMIGVLNFDSDDKVLDAFAHALDKAIDIARVIAYVWVELAEKGTVSLPTS